MCIEYYILHEITTIFFQTSCSTSEIDLIEDSPSDSHTEDQHVSYANFEMLWCSTFMNGSV